MGIISIIPTVVASGLYSVGIAYDDSQANSYGHDDSQGEQPTLRSGTALVWGWGRTHRQTKAGAGGYGQATLGYNGNTPPHFRSIRVLDITR